MLEWKLEDRNLMLHSVFLTEIKSSSMKNLIEYLTQNTSIQKIFDTQCSGLLITQLIIQDL
jgi:hypothetical protein